MRYTVPLARLAVLFCSGAAPAQLKKSADVVKITATADKADESGNQTVTITLDIENGWHLYANPVENDTFTSAQTSVKFGAAVENAKIAYPPGKLVKDKLAGDYNKYEGKVTIKAQVKRAKGAEGPLEFSIKIQACDKNSCLFPATVKKSVP